MSAKIFWMTSQKQLRSLWLCLFLLLPFTSAKAESLFVSSWTEIVKSDFQNYKNTTPEALKTQITKGQVKVVVFWADWCGFCKSELKMLSQYQKNLAAGQLNIIAVNQDTRFELGADKAKLYDGQMLFVHDKNGALKKKLNVSKLPLTLIYSEGGEFQTAYSGFSNERFNYIRKRINSLLKNGDGEN